MAVCYQPGLRIGVLIFDDTSIVYSPTPLLIEAGSDRADQPNAIQIGVAEVENQLLRACAAEGENGNDMPLPKAMQKLVRLTTRLVVTRYYS